MQNMTRSNLLYFLCLSGRRARNVPFCIFLSKIRGNVGIYHDPRFGVPEGRLSVSSNYVAVPHEFCQSGFNGINR